IGGLISSTLLTLVLVPVLYSLVERARERLGRRRAGRESTSAPAGQPSPPAVPPAVSRPAPPVEAARASGAPSVTGLVTTADGTPLPSAVLTLVGTEGHQVGQATSSGDGSYRILAPANGSYLLICRGPTGDRDPQATWVSIDGRTAQHHVVLIDNTRSRT
ncbi:MAG: carboxypeptidase-like regulatory domain-containing protein, partial [Pseudonocardiaceae bacterium]